MHAAALVVFPALRAIAAECTEASADALNVKLSDDNFKCQRSLGILLQAMTKFSFLFKVDNAVWEYFFFLVLVYENGGDAGRVGGRGGGL